MFEYTTGMGIVGQSLGLNPSETMENGTG